MSSCCGNQKRTIVKEDQNYLREKTNAKSSNWLSKLVANFKQDEKQNRDETTNESKNEPSSCCS